MALITYIIVVILIILSGMFSGLTLGLMSLNKFDLKRKVKLGNRDAIKIYPLRKHGNLLLCTLLLGNVAVNSALAIFLGSITSGVFAGILATALIVVFGEIVPQSIFSQYALKFGGKFTWLVYIFLYALYPLTKPMAWVLDKALGGELPTHFSKKEFLLFLDEQKDLNSDISKREYEILRNGLVFSEKMVKDVMTPRVNTYYLRQNAILTKTNLEKIHATGHSRIPVYDNNRDKIVGVLYAKDLIAVNPRNRVMVEEIMKKKIISIRKHDKLDKVLQLFKQKKVHLLVVKDEFGGIDGIITLEDVLEEVVGEIIDEYDHMIDMRKVN